MHFTIIPTGKRQLYIILSKNVVVEEKFDEMVYNFLKSHGTDYLFYFLKRKYIYKYYNIAKISSDD